MGLRELVACRGSRVTSQCVRLSRQEHPAALQFGLARQFDLQILSQFVQKLKSVEVVCACDAVEKKKDCTH